MGARRHGRARPSSSARAATTCAQPGGTGYGVRLIVELARASRELRSRATSRSSSADTVREFAETRVAPVAAELDREQRFPYELVAELAELGLMGMPIPEEYGGAGADTRLVRDRGRGADAHRLVGRDHGRRAHARSGRCRSYLFGTEEQKREWLPELASGRKLAAFGLTEPDAGSDAGATRTTRRAARRPVGRQRLEDLHHERGHRHHRVRDDHRASPATTRSRT